MPRSRQPIQALADLDIAPVGPVFVTGRLMASGPGSYYWEGRVRTEVRVTCRRCLEGANRSRLALHLAKTGDTEAALAELAKVLTPDVVEVNTLFRGAVSYQLAGRRDEALSVLERALERGYGLIEIRMDPELANLRTDARYHRLAARFDAATPK